MNSPTFLRRTSAKAVVAVSLAIALLVPSMTWAPVPASGQTAATQPTTETARSLYLSNWDDTVGLWMASKLSQEDTNTQYGPRLSELRFGSNMADNQIVDYSAFFRDETNAVKYNQINNFQADGYLDSGGVLRTSYETYSGTPTPMEIERDYNVVPNEDFIVVTYELTNPTTSSLTYNVLDSLHVNNLDKGNGTLMHGYYDSTRDAIVTDMSASGQYYLVLGSYGQHDSYQIGDDTNANLTSSGVAPWYAFDDNGTLPNNSDQYAADLSLAFQDEVTVPAGETRTSSFYLAIESNLSSALTAADTARGQTASQWETTTTTDYTSWLNNGKQTSFTDNGVNTAYDRALIAAKHSQNPVLGTWPATTNPIAYGYKTWARDSAMTAIVLDAAGHHTETDQYFRWLASVQKPDGTFATTFDNWTGAYVPFVEPEHDSIGMFLVGIWRHYEATGDEQFLDDLWPAVRLSANWIIDNIDSNGLGAADASIWEETIEHNTFTQALFVSGLRAAQHMAQAQGATSDVDWWAGGPASILTAMQRSSLQSPAGMWNSPDNYYNRAVKTDDTARTLVDGSSNMLFLMAAMDPSSSRAAPHVSKIENELTHDGFGIARYNGDVFYHTAPFSPGGDEALAPEPSWPQMSCYAALYEIYTGDLSTALQRLQWYVSRTGVGYMPPGEAVSNVSLKPVVSTMVEPVTGAWFVLTALVYEGQHDPWVLAPLANAGAQKTISVDPGTAGDWPEWEQVPYYLDEEGDSVSGDATTDIRNVAISNDSNNVYVRIDNVSGSLPGYQTQPLFATHVYSEDYASSPSVTYRSQGFNGGQLDRPMAYMVGRWSDSADFPRFKATSSGWNFDSFINGVIAPQWDTTTGRVELVIPRSALTSTPVSDGTYAKLDIGLARRDPSTGNWVDDDLIQINYRMTGSSTPWIYGNVR